jgi:hypothetical protein
VLFSSSVFFCFFGECGDGRGLRGGEMERWGVRGAACDEDVAVFEGVGHVGLWMGLGKWELEGELCFINYKSRATVSVTGGLMWHRSPPPHCSRVWGTWTPHVALS